MSAMKHAFIIKAFMGQFGVLPGITSVNTSGNYYYEGHSTFTGKIHDAKKHATHEQAAEQIGLFNQDSVIWQIEKIFYK